MFTGLRTSIQAIGFLWMKESQDPLEGVQQLDYMNLVSTVQRMTPEYLPNLLISTQW
jgi:hypothetical protein